MLGHRHVRFLHLLQSTTDAWRKRFVSAILAAPEISAVVSSTESQRIRQSTLRKAFHAPRLSTLCVDAVTEFCDSCHSQGDSRPDDVSFHVQAYTRRTTQQCFQQAMFRHVVAQ